MPLLQDLELPPVMVTATENLIREFYNPVLACSVSYDRGVGFFSSQWIRLVASGLVGLVANRGSARLVVSPILEPTDWDAMRAGVSAQTDPILRKTLERTIEELERDLEEDTCAAIASMISSDFLEFRLAIPNASLDGDFHDKFGIFGDGTGNEIAFHGSANDSAQAFRKLRIHRYLLFVAR